MFYVLFRLLCQLSLRAFFRRIEVEGDPDARPGPVLFVANHANSLVDPLLLMIASRRRITLTAKSGLWGNPLLRLLRWGLGIVSFERRGPGSGVAAMRANAASLARCGETLAAGGALCIFPEGISHSDPAMRPFQPGAARIALDCASRQDGGAALRIVPVGFFYTDKSRLRSGVWVRFGEPLDVGAWIGSHPGAGAGDLTALIRRRVEELTLAYRDEREARVLGWAARLSPLAPERRDDSAEPSALFRRLARLRSGLRTRTAEDGAGAAALVRLLVGHREELEARGVPPEAFRPRHRDPAALVDVVRRAELLLLGAPPALLGLACHLPPLLAVRGVARALSRDEDHWATNTVYPAMLIFPLWYVAQVAVASWWLGAWALGAAALLPWTGGLALLWFEEAALAWTGLRGRLRLVASRDRARLAAITRELSSAVAALECGGRVAAFSLPDGDEGTPDPALDARLETDASTLPAVIEAMERLESWFVESGASDDAEARGYFTPDEDDRVRRLLVAFRSLRASLWELIRRYWDYERLGSPRDRARGFLIGYAAALTSYALCLKLIRHCEGARRLRAKLDEPDERFGVDAGFFGEILEANTSWRNARALARAGRFWQRERARLAEHGLDRDPVYVTLARVVDHQEAVVRRTLWSILARRLRYDWRALWRSAAYPIGRLAYTVTCFWGSRIAELRIQPAPHAIGVGVLEEVSPRLRVGDLVLVRHEAKLTASLLPGFWSHVALFLGDLAPAGGTAPFGSVVEARAPGVGVRPLHHCLEADHLLVLRPRLDADECRSAVRDALTHVGKAYDFEMDFSTTTRIVCTELVYRAYHGRGGIDFPLVRRLGRPTLSCDDIVGRFLASAEAPGTPLFSVVWLSLRFADGGHRRVPPAAALEWLRRIDSGARPGLETSAGLSRKAVPA